MKKLLFIAAIAAFASCAGGSDHKISESEVPGAVSAAFTTKYPGATNVQWEREAEDGKTLYEAEFKMNEQKMEAFWDENGGFVREEKD